MPDSLQTFGCDSNSITSLPVLPKSLKNLSCINNKISCFAPFPDSLSSNGGSIRIFYNPFTCLPNYTSAMDFITLSYPLCTAGNLNGCPSVQGIFGYTYKDINANYIADASDSALVNIPLSIYDNSNNLLGKTYSALNAVYDFPQTGGTYKVMVDTMASFPLIMQCAHPGYDSLVTINTIDTNINFALTGKPGFDIGVQSIATNGAIFPGQKHNLYITAGDLNQWYGLSCASGISGQVQVIINGPVTYVSPDSFALTPIVSGNQYTYNIADFGAIDFTTAFNLIMVTDTTAQSGDTVCMNINVTPTTGDNNSNNNNYSFCYQVINSHDPNFKETYPINVAPAYQNWFTYTIHFQNTGSAAAFNIHLEDTLDANLDLSTFQVINYNHPNKALLNDNVLTFNFHNINLPDSASNPKGSSGFVQYRINPKANLPAGTQIKNTAYIYFDYNAAIVTNTSLNNFGTPLSIKKFNTQQIISIYPNPANNKITIDANDVAEVKLFDVLGKQIFTTKTTDVDVSNLPEGVYFIQVQTIQNTTTQKIIVQH